MVRVWVSVRLRVRVRVSVEYDFDPTSYIVSRYYKNGESVSPVLITSNILKACLL